MKRAPYARAHPAKSTEARGRTKFLDAAHQVPAFQQGLKVTTNLERHHLPSRSPGSANGVLRKTVPHRIPSGDVPVVAMPERGLTDIETAPLWQEAERVVQNSIFCPDQSNLA